MGDQDPRIERFFVDPSVEHTTLGPDISVLYLLRRDVNFCFGIDNLTGRRDQARGAALFPGTMTIMAGIDLLGKFLAGDDAPENMGQRFQNFVRRYVRMDDGRQVNRDEAWCFLQLRHSLDHSFGLIAKPPDRNRPADLVRFVLTENAMSLIAWIDLPGNPRIRSVTIDVRRLRDRFEEAIQSYRNDLSGNGPDGDQLPNNFARIWNEYGVVRHMLP